jgi:hypothetical protein
MHARFLERTHRARSVVCFPKTSLKTEEIYRKSSSKNRGDFINENTPLNIFLLILIFQRCFVLYAREIFRKNTSSKKRGLLSKNKSKNRRNI